MADEKNQKEIDAIKADVENLRGDIASLTEHLKGLARSGTDQARETAEVELKRLRKELDRVVGSVSDSGRRSVDRVEQEITERPFMSLLLAFGIGLVLGKLFDRR